MLELENPLHGFFHEGQLAVLEKKKGGSNQ
jgi:hypothetical protein